MFPLERLIGISIYVSLLLLVCYLIIRLKKENRRGLLTIYLFGITLMAFFYVPAVEADLYRHIEAMLEITQLDYDELTELVLASGSPLSIVYMKLIGSLGVIGLLSAITTFIVFGNIFHIVHNVSSKINASKKAVATALLLIMSTGIFMQTVSGIRNMLAFSIIARCFYDEVFNKKRAVLNVPWYIVACLIHPSAIAAVAIRLISYIYTTNGFKRARTILITALTGLAVGYLFIRMNGIQYIENAIIKLQLYITSVSYSYGWDTLIAIITLAILLINYKLHRNSESAKLNTGFKATLQFSYLLTAFSVIFILEHTIFVRFLQLSLIVMIPIILHNISLYANLRSRDRLEWLFRLQFYFIFLILIVSASRGALSSLKFFIA